MGPGLKEEMRCLKDMTREGVSWLRGMWEDVLEAPIGPVYLWMSVLVIRRLRGCGEGRGGGWAATYLPGAPSPLVRRICDGLIVFTVSRV